MVEEAETINERLNVRIQSGVILGERANLMAWIVVLSHVSHSNLPL